MRRIRIILAGLFVFIVLLVLIAYGTGRDSTAPRFVPGAPTVLPSFTWDHYDWNSPAPFAEGKLWLWIAKGTNYHAYLYDLQERKILGELLNAAIPVLRTRDNSRLLSVGRDSPVVSVKQRLVDWIRKRFGRSALSSVNRTETFWLLDLRKNSATRVGSIDQFSGSGSGWCPSPSMRYGFTIPTTALDSWLVLCDLQSNSFTRVPVQGHPRGWWDDQDILLNLGTNGFGLLDIRTLKARTLFSFAELSNFLAQADLAADPAGLGTLSTWNGHDYNFYLGPKGLIHGLSGSNSFLLTIDRSGPALKLLYRDFKYQWGGHLDNSATRYIYQGEGGKPGNCGNGAVYARDLTNNTELTIVPADNGGQYAIPSLYRDEVIYFRKRLLRRIKLDGSQDEPLLAQPAEETSSQKN